MRKSRNKDKVQTNVWLEAYEYDWLRTEAFTTRKSQAEIIRNMINNEIERRKNEAKKEDSN